MRLPKAALPHKIQVEHYLGTGSLGDVYDNPKTWRARVDYENKLVRDINSEEVVSSSEVMLEVAALEHCAIGSRVTLPGETVSRTVISGGPVWGNRRPVYIQLSLK